MTFKEYLTTLPQYILPHHPLSRMMGILTHSKNIIWKNFFINQIIRQYHVNMDEAAEQNLDNFQCFNDFFTRELKSGIRPISDLPGNLACPADGSISQCGEIKAGSIFQAKGKNYTVLDLLGGDATQAAVFENGNFATIYLSPKDYHRLHMPIAGTLRKMIHIPGRLFSVNGATANSVSGLFARNERVVAIFDTEVGPMALILVGAIFVASIETVWHGVVTPPASTAIQTWIYSDNAPSLARGAEMGRFNMGSTIIVLFAKDQMAWSESLQTGETVKLGQLIGKSL